LKILRRKPFSSQFICTSAGDEVSLSFFFPGRSYAPLPFHSWDGSLFFPSPPQLGLIGCRLAPLVPLYEENSLFSLFCFSCSEDDASPGFPPDMPLVQAYFSSTVPHFQSALVITSPLPFNRRGRLLMSPTVNFPLSFFAFISPFCSKNGYRASYWTPLPRSCVPSPSFQLLVLRGFPLHGGQSVC